MITFFTIPRPFEGATGVRQRNAILSWSRLEPRCEIVLCGDEPGTAELAAEIGARQCAALARNRFGTPLLDGAFAAATAIARFPLVCYVNADIILFDDMIAAARRIPFDRFLMVGARLNVAHPEERPLAPAELAALRERALAAGDWADPHGSDYFLFPRGALGPIPPFAVGRVGWDNWMMYHARALGMPLIDATTGAIALHQDHDYAHVLDPATEDSPGTEGEENHALAGRARHYVLIDATHIMTPAGLRRALSWDHLVWRVRRAARRLVPLWLIPPRG